MSQLLLQAELENVIINILGEGVGGRPAPARSSPPLRSRSSDHSATQEGEQDREARNLTRREEVFVRIQGGPYSVPKQGPDMTRAPQGDRRRRQRPYSWVN